MTEKTYTAVVDRVVEETAVLLLEAEGEVVDQLDVPISELPEPAQEGGGVLTVTVADGRLVDAEFEVEETTRRRESAAEKLDRLSRRLSDENEDS